jgi:hypothetical protein
MQDPLHVYIQPYHQEIKKYSFVLADADKVQAEEDHRSEEILWMV